MNPNIFAHGSVTDTSDSLGKLIHAWLQRFFKPPKVSINTVPLFQFPPSKQKPFFNDQTRSFDFLLTTTSAIRFLFPAHQLLRLLHNFTRLPALQFRLQRCVPAAEMEVLQIPVSLGNLRRAIYNMATEEEIVPRRDGESVAHEDGAVEGKGACHGSGDTAA